MGENIFAKRLREMADKRAIQDSQDEEFSKLVFSEDQLAAIELALQGKNLFLTGKAGTGKTFVLKAIIHKLRKKNVAVLGTTGIAAMNAQGVTMHSFFRVPVIEGVITEENVIFVNRDVRAMWNATEVVIIDEVSMCRADQLDSIEWSLMKNGCKGLHTKQVIFCGDLKQLPPVVKDAEEIMEVYKSEYFYSAEVYDELNVTEVELQTIHRQSDPEFIQHLNTLRDEGTVDTYFDQFVVEKAIGTIICPYKQTAVEHNRRELNKIDAKRHIFRPEIEGDASIVTLGISDKLVLKHGAKVMHIVNTGGLVNGSIGIVEIEMPQGEDTEPVLFFCQVINGEDYRRKIDRHRFEKHIYELDEISGRLRKKLVGAVIAYPLTLAYAMTIHKSQGLTFDELTVDLTRECFINGQLYTALSRVREPNGLHILV